MELKGILSLSGKPGLFQMVKQAHNSIIVESLENKRRMPAYATSKVSSLEDIAVFTENGDTPLLEVFKNIYKKENGGSAIDHKVDKKDLFAYFEQVLPDYDKEKVYHSDIKRIINWYNILVEHKLIDFTEDELNGVSKETAEEQTEEKTEENTEEAVNE